MSDADFDDLDDLDIGQFLDDDEDDQVSQQVAVTTPAGASVTVMNQDEADYYNEVATRYQADNKFSNISDILELDRILTMELMCYRWSLWILTGHDYTGRRINPTEVQKSIETYSKEIRGIKKDLGIDKSTRDKGGAESVGEYIENLRVRAREFGITRNKQAVRAITLLMQLRALITLYDNSTESERKEFNVTAEELFQWIREQFEEFEEIDKALRENQKYWIRELNS